MKDLTKIKKPFGMLGKKTQARLRALPAADGAVQGYSTGGDWSVLSHPAWVTYHTYRQSPTWVPKPAFHPMSMPWDAIDDRWVCAARDKNGRVYLYARRPTLRKYCWNAAQDLSSTDALKFNPGTTPWDQSLVWRPGCGQAADA
jgi:hypothetical protein